jgi:hypothetical protein
MSRIQVLPGLEAAGHARHVLHADDRIWMEKNCYVDILIELLHALHCEPLAMMGFCAALEFEGDSFTFFKPGHDELRALYGLDVQELNVWRPLVDHATEHLRDGKFISTEADSFFLPDTAGTDYRRNHVKTTIILADIDVGCRRLGYFHNAGYFTLEGDDFAALFRVGASAEPGFLPLFAELVRVDRLVRRPGEELASMARVLLAHHVMRRPATNPIDRFRSRFEADLQAIQREGLAYYHLWAFATARQLGAAFELLALHLLWLGEQGAGAGLESAARDFELLSQTARTLILKAARAVNGHKPLDASAAFDAMSGAWERGMTTLVGNLIVPVEGVHA